MNSCCSIKVILCSAWTYIYTRTDAGAARRQTFEEIKCITFEKCDLDLKKIIIMDHHPFERAKLYNYNKYILNV